MPKLKIQPVAHHTLSQIVTGRLAALILDGRLKQGERLPPERELIEQLGVSRSTLREGLKSLAQNRLIEVRPGVGSFVRPLDRSNYAQATELALAHRTRGVKISGLPSPAPKVKIEPPEGPRPLQIPAEKPLRIPDLKKDRLGTFDFISWWDRERVETAKVMVVGAGALGNEVIKNLTLMGVGNLFIVDFDSVEAANLSRSILFRERDYGRPKAEIAAARAKSINPNIHVQYFNGDVSTQLGLGVFRRMDVVIGCLDNREARMAVNRFCHWTNKPWVDGAIMELLGLARVFVPGEGACYECTLTEQARRDMSLRYSCPLLARHNLLLGKVPTTPTIAAIIGGIQSQEALKIIHQIEVKPGKVVHYNGMTNEMHHTHYLPREDCESHWTYAEIAELPNKAHNTTLAELLEIVRADLGAETVIELDQELVLSLECPQCKTTDEILRPISEVSHDAARCPICGLIRTVNMTHTIAGDEPFLDRSLKSLGVPALHVLRAHNDREYRFFELSGDLPEALHFGDFSTHAPGSPAEIRLRVRLGPVTAAPEDVQANPARGRVVIHG